MFIRHSRTQKIKSIAKLAASAAVVFTLNGCLEVEDNNDDDVVAALAAQNSAIEANKTPISLFGSVVDAGTNQMITEAIITIKVGSVWQEPISVSGEFLIENLPVNTDVVVLVQSPGNAFMDRAFYGKTESVESGQVASQSLGDLKVSQAVVKNYSVLDFDTSEPFQGLEFVYNPTGTFSSGSQLSGIAEYVVKSTYSDETGIYSVTIPKDLSYGLAASGDLDNDGIIDFKTTDSSFWGYDGISLSTNEALQLEVLYVNETEAYQPVELRISAIDSFGSSIEGIEITASDRFSGRFDTSYDVDTEEYVFNYQTSSTVDMIMPSFTTDEGITYQSAYINLTWATAENLSIYDGGFVNNLPSNIDVVDGVASIVVLPREVSYQDSVSLVSSEINVNDNYSLNQFYQSPIGLVEDSISLAHTNVFKVVKGDDSADDLVPEGTTQLGFVSEEITVTDGLSHNNTFLIVSPVSTLEEGQYRYEIDQLVNEQTGLEFSMGFSTNFEVEAQSSDFGVFSIGDVMFDNNNGTSAGETIVAQNSAGDASTVSNSNNTARLYFPRSILSLDYLELNLVSYMSDGAEISRNRQVKVVEDENVFLNTRNLVSLAANENVESLTGSYSVPADTQTALTDGLWYYTTGAGVYASDNTAGEVNSATFNYIYRIKGETTVYEGTITLPVL